MAGIAMAEGRRGMVFLHQRVLRLLLAHHPRPLSGLELVALLQAEGDMVSASQVYRALRRLTDEGAARKILVAGGYLPVGQEAALLWCRGCGKVEAAACPDAFRRLNALARRAGLAGPNCRIEVPGLCADCAAHSPA